MNIDWKYQPLFTINVVPAVLQDRSFRVEPSNECLALLRAAGFSFRPIENGTAVCFEKRILPDGIIKTINRVQKTIGFTFLLKCNNLELFKQTTPQLSGNLPAFSGKQRILYFDNLSAGNTIDRNLTHQTPVPSIDYKFATMPLSIRDRVSIDDLASTFANKFQLTVDENVVQIALEPIMPNAAAPQVFPSNDENRKVSLTLGSGGYYLNRVLSTTGDVREVVVIGNDLLTPDVVGVLQIFKDVQVDYGVSIQYDIIF
jgi:hypothetical protein